MRAQLVSLEGMTIQTSNPLHIGIARCPCDRPRGTLGEKEECHFQQDDVQPKVNPYGWRLRWRGVGGQLQSGVQTAIAVEPTAFFHTAYNTKPLHWLTSLRFLFSVR